MVLVIGKENCSRCDMVKTILKNKSVEFEYVLMESLDENTQKKYRKMAIESKHLEMPLIIKDNLITNISEVK